MTTTSRKSTSRNATRKPRKTAAPVALKVIISEYAAKRDVNETDAGKRVRAAIRAHKADLAKLDANLANHVKGNGYVPFAPKCADAIRELLKLA